MLVNRPGLQRFPSAPLRSLMLLESRVALPTRTLDLSSSRSSSSECSRCAAGEWIDREACDPVRPGGACSGELWERAARREGTQQLWSVSDA